MSEEHPKRSLWTTPVDPSAPSRKLVDPNVTREDIQAAVDATAERRAQFNPKVDPLIWFTILD